MPLPLPPETKNAFKIYFIYHTSRSSQEVSFLRAALGKLLPLPPDSSPARTNVLSWPWERFIDLARKSNEPEILKHLFWRAELVKIVLTFPDQVEVIVGLPRPGRPQTLMDFDYHTDPGPLEEHFLDAVLYREQLSFAIGSADKARRQHRRFFSNLDLVTSEDL